MNANRRTRPARDHCRYRLIHEAKPGSLRAVSVRFYGWLCGFWMSFMCCAEVYFVCGVGMRPRYEQGGGVSESGKGEGVLAMVK
mmetsp:Transcript_30132/g.69542  ORF Transcript_30132/g.69542 Transcript_30132/m.69542 type:complete len:84 (-) Transcript_30132:59-310(-)